MAASAVPRSMVSMSSSGHRRRVSKVVAVMMASMQVRAQRLSRQATEELRRTRGLCG